MCNNKKISMPFIMNDFSKFSYYYKNRKEMIKDTPRVEKCTAALIDRSLDRIPLSSVDKPV